MWVNRKVGPVKVFEKEGPTSMTKPPKVDKKEHLADAG